MAKSKGMQVCKPIEQLVVIINFFLGGEKRSFADNIPQRPSIDKLQHHTHILETT